MVPNYSEGSGATTFGGTQLHVLQATPGWQDAVDRLRDLADRDGERAASEASAFADRFAGQRAAMVFDVVQSANRRYDTIVAPRVRRFEETPVARSLRAFAEAGPPDRTGFRRNEADSMVLLAGRLADHCDRLGEGEDEGCLRWATGDDPGVLHHLDPVIGRVKGIGFTLYRYLRMRAGADDVKPDRRVAIGLERCGFPLFTRPEHIYVLALATAAETGLRPLVLDQLLWFDT
jgi:hypothetical protein